MKNLKFLFVLLVSLSILSTGCDKNDDPADPSGNYKGSFSVDINGINYNKKLIRFIDPQLNGFEYLQIINQEP